MKKNPSPEFHIGRRLVGENRPAFIVAEMSCNHGGDFTTAECIIRAAARARADAVKLQTYSADTMTIDAPTKWFAVGGGGNPDSWKGETLYSMYKKSYTPWEWHAPLQKLAAELGLAFFSTPFDQSAVDFLETLSVPCYKIAAYEANDLELLRAVATTGKPVFVSVGFSTVSEIEESLDALWSAGAKDIAFLHSTASYKKDGKGFAPNLRTIADIGKRFGVLPGFSDNCGGIETAILAVEAGARIVEKHLVVGHDPKLLDDSFSLDEKEFATMVARIRSVEQLLGEVAYGPKTKEERHNLRYRRSLFAVMDIQKGEVLTRDNIRSIRPGMGLSPRELPSVLGKKARKDIARGTPLSKPLVSKK